MSRDLVEETLNYMSGMGHLNQLNEAKMPKNGKQYAKMSSSLSNKMYDVWEKTYKKFLKKGKPVTIRGKGGFLQIRVEGDEIKLDVDTKVAKMKSHIADASKFGYGNGKDLLPIERGDMLSGVVGDFIAGAGMGRKWNKSAGFYPAEKSSGSFEKMQESWLEYLEVQEQVLEYMKSLQKKGDLTI